MAPEFLTASVKLVAPAQPATLCRAYLTLLDGKGDSVKGVVGLAKGLRKVGSAYRLVVAVFPDVPVEHRRILKDQGCVVREIEPVYPLEDQTQFSMADYVIKYSKLRFWEFVEYSKMVYLDVGMQVFDNIDHLFDMEDGYFYAVMDCFCEKTWSHTLQYAIGYCQQCPDKVQWRDEMGPRPSVYFNDSMFMFEPNRATFEDLSNTLKTTFPTPFAQDLLNMYFRHIYKPLSLEYNLDISMLSRHPENVEIEKVKAVLFGAAGSKPWMCTGQEDTDNMQRENLKIQVKKLWDFAVKEDTDNMQRENLKIQAKKLSDFAVKEDVKRLVEKWWEIYKDETLDYKNWIWRPRKRPTRSTSHSSGPNKRSAK